jgi:hypothetical protein
MYTFLLNEPFRRKSLNFVRHALRFYTSRFMSGKNITFFQTQNDLDTAVSHISTYVSRLYKGLRAIVEIVLDISVNM